MLEAARKEGAGISTILPQAEFLRRLGIETRTEALAAGRPERRAQLRRQLQRLIAPGEMGELFKAACIHTAGVVPPAFEEV